MYDYDVDETEHHLPALMYSPARISRQSHSLYPTLRYIFIYFTFQSEAALSELVISIIAVLMVNSFAFSARLY
jgi:hypothetical protein